MEGNELATQGLRKRILEQMRVGEAAGRSLLNHAPILEHRNAVRNTHRQLKIVRDEDDARTGIGKCPKIIDSPYGKFDVKSRRGFIGNQKARLLHKGAHEQYATRHAARELMGIHLLDLGCQAIQLEQFPLTNLAAATVAQPLRTRNASRSALNLPATRMSGSRCDTL